MTPAQSITFQEFRGAVGRLIASPAQTHGSSESVIREAADYLVAMKSVEVDALAAAIKEHPTWVPALGLVAGLSQERLRNELKQAFDTLGWITLARTKPREVVEMLDEQFNLIERLNAERQKQHTLADVLIARAEGRSSAGGAISRGRNLEDKIEAIIKTLNVPYQPRTRFEGRAGGTAPCDFAIPQGGRDAQIVCAAKGFNSTGSKLTDAFREVLAMADVRLPSQYVFAVVDGLGWRSRESDLRRIYELWESRKIDGLYTQSMLDEFKGALEVAIQRLGIPSL